MSGTEVRETFRAQFVQIARVRHERAAELASRNEAAELRSAASELHCLSGEASMLDFAQVADLARVAEEAAREGDRARLNVLLRELQGAIFAVEHGVKDT